MLKSHEVLAIFRIYVGMVPGMSWVGLLTRSCVLLIRSSVMLNFIESPGGQEHHCFFSNMPKTYFLLRIPFLYVEELYDSKAKNIS